MKLPLDPNVIKKMRRSGVEFGNSFCNVLKFCLLNLPLSRTLVNDVKPPEKNGRAYMYRESCIWFQDVTDPSRTPLLFFECQVRHS